MRDYIHRHVSMRLMFMLLVIAECMGVTLAAWLVMELIHRFFSITLMVLVCLFGGNASLYLAL